MSNTFSIIGAQGRPIMLTQNRVAAIALSTSVVVVPSVFSFSAGSYSITGFPAQFVSYQPFTTAAGSYSISGFPIKWIVVWNVAHGVYSISGSSAALTSKVLPTNQCPCPPVVTKETRIRTYGRLDSNGNSWSGSGPYTWVVVTVDDHGFYDNIWATTLVQVLKLNLGESPFYANYGIPAYPSVVTQVFPDFFVARTQQQFAKFFGSLIISKEQATSPTYRVNIVTNTGAILSKIAT